MLERIWLGRSGMAGNDGGGLLEGMKGGGNWIEDLRGRGVGWLIL